MTPPAVCPDCGKKLAPGAEACSNCPWSYVEPEADGNPLRSSRLHPAVLPAAFLALMGLSIWKMGMGLLTLGRDSRPERASLERAGVPVTSEEAKAALGDAPRPAAENAAAEAPAAGEEPGQGIISVVKTRAAAREWRLRGAVYDLLTLKPVAGVKLTFIDNETNDRAETVTDARGRYKTLLPALVRRGYLVSIAKPGYASSYAGPEAAGVSEMDLGSRRVLARQLARSVEEPSALEPGGAEPLVTNFFLAPADRR